MNILAIILPCLVVLVLILVLLYNFWVPTTKKLRINIKRTFKPTPDASTSSMHFLYRPEMRRFLFGWSGFNYNSDTKKTKISSMWYYDKNINIVENMFYAYQMYKFREIIVNYEIRINE